MPRPMCANTAGKLKSQAESFNGNRIRCSSRPVNMVRHGTYPISEIMNFPVIVAILRNSTIRDAFAGLSHLTPLGRTCFDFHLHSLTPCVSTSAQQGVWRNVNWLD